MAIDIVRKSAPQKAVAKKVAATKKAASSRPRYDDDDDDRPSTRRRGGEPAGASRGHSRSGWQAADEAMSGSGFVNNVKLKDGEEIVLRFLEDEPYASLRIHWLERSKGKRSYPCPGDPKKPLNDNGCPFCEYGISFKSEVRFNIAVLTEEDPIIQSLHASPRLQRKIRSFADDPKFRPLSKKWYFYRRTGSKWNDTEYSLDIARSVGDIEEYYPNIHIASSDELEQLVLYTTADADKEFAPLGEMRKVADEVVADDDDAS